MLVKELKAYCKKHKIKGYSKLNKSELIELVNGSSRKPVKKSRKPVKKSRKPVKKSRKPKKTSRKPKKTSRKPKKTSRKPVKKSRKPKKTSRKQVEKSRKQVKKSSKTKRSSKSIILILKSADDHNGAFDKVGDRGLFAVFNSYIELTKNKYQLIYKDNISNVYEIKHILDNLKHKIAHLIIMSHGNTNSLDLSRDYEIKSDSKEMTVLSKSLNRKLLPNASILLHSCLVGKGGPKSDNFAKNLAKNLPGHIIYGAERSIHRGDLDLQYIFTNEQDGSLLPIYHIEKYPLYDFCFKKNGKEC